jgi:hypothetical protein
VKLNVRLLDHDFETIFDGDLEEGEHASCAVHVSEWEGKRFVAEDIEVWFFPDTVEIVRGVGLIHPGAITVSYVDNTDTKPGATQHAAVRQTIERPLPGGGIGPFYATVS